MKAVAAIREPRKRRLYFEPFKGHETPRRCKDCAEPAVAFVFQSDRTGLNRDKTSRRPVCRRHLAELGGNL
jgi:hypothetical protein